MSTVDNYADEYYPGAKSFTQYVKELNHPTATTDDLQNYVSYLRSNVTEKNNESVLDSPSWHANDAIVNGLNINPGSFSTQGMNR